MFSFPKDSHVVVISPTSILLAIGFILGLYVLFLIRGVVALLFLAFILMTALHPVVKKLNAKLRVPWVLAIVVVYILFILLFSSVLALIVPPLGNQLYQLVKEIEIPFLQEEITSIRFTVSEISSLVPQVGNSVNLVMSIISTTFSGVLTFFTLILLSMYIMVDRPYLHKKVAWFSKNVAYQQVAKELLDDLELQLGGWVLLPTLV
jgi:predicted PurR-regulated permease PerM